VTFNLHYPDEKLLEYHIFFSTVYRLSELCVISWPKKPHVYLWVVASVRQQCKNQTPVYLSSTKAGIVFISLKSFSSNGQ